MKLLAVFILIIISASDTFAQDGDCKPDLPPCTDVHDIAKIDCSDGVPCSLTKGDLAGDGDLGYLLDPAINTIDENLCSKKCKEQADHEDQPSENKCKFYRWENVSDFQPLHPKIQYYTHIKLLLNRTEMATPSAPSRPLVTYLTPGAMNPTGTAARGRLVALMMASPTLSPVPSTKP